MTHESQRDGHQHASARARFDAWGEVRSLLVAHRRQLAAGMMLVALGSLAGVVLPVLTKFVVDDVIVKRREELLPLIALAGVAATCVQAAAGFTVSQLLGVTAQRTTTEMQRRVQAHVMRLPMRAFYTTQTGALLSRVMNDAAGLRNLIGLGMVHFAGAIVTAVIGLALLLYLNWRMTVVIALMLTGLGFGMARAFGYLRPLFRERARLVAEVNSGLAQTLAGIRVVKVCSAERREARAFARGTHRLLRCTARALVGSSVATSGATLITGAFGVTFMLLGGRETIAGRMTLGELTMYVSLVGAIALPIVSIANVGTQITEAIAGLDRINETLSQPTEDQFDRGKAPLGEIDGDIRFDNVSFEYQAGTPVLKNLSFHAPAGTTTALVGRSGSGKSTLLDLVMAVHSPTHGRILVDGQDLSVVRLHDYRSQLGPVLQDGFLFDGTVADNVRYSRPSAAIAEVEAAARQAGCDQFIRQLPDGFATVVGERGVRLSGGQQQRLSIARALLAAPKILILDEATSSVDSETEVLIQDAINLARGGRTTFVIAHRLSTIRNADQILVLDDGRIVERGSHSELMAGRGRYRQLYDSQLAQRMCEVPT